MTRRQKRDALKNLRSVAIYLKSVAIYLFIVAFAMTAGAGCYHHYLLANEEAVQQYVKSARYHTETVEDYNAIRYEMLSVEHQEEMELIALEDGASEDELYCDELELMAICIEAEAGNQDIDGKRLVADVILNRVDDPDFPDTIEGVITQKYAFSSYWNGAMDRVYEPAESTFKAVQMELEQRSWPSVLYFTSKGYSKYGTPWKKVGDHYFSTK